MGKNVTTSLGNKTKFAQLVDSFGLPRIIITGFLLLLFVLVPFAGVDFATQISNVIKTMQNNSKKLPYAVDSYPLDWE